MPWENCGTGGVCACQLFLGFGAWPRCDVSGVFIWALESWIWGEQGCGTCWAGAQAWAELLPRNWAGSEGGTDCPVPSGALGNKPRIPSENQPLGHTLASSSGVSETLGAGAGSRTLHVGRGICAPPLMEQGCSGCSGVLGWFRMLRMFRGPWAGLSLHCRVSVELLPGLGAVQTPQGM